MAVDCLEIQAIRTHLSNGKIFLLACVQASHNCLDTAQGVYDKANN
jgi:hypothetical protein